MSAAPDISTLEAAPVSEEITPSSPAALTPPAASGERCDFRHPVFLSSAEWRKIRVEVEEFKESLGALLSTYFRLEFGLQLSKLDTGTFSEFTASLPASTHLTLFRLEPLRGLCVLEIRPEIGLGIIDRVLGGPGKPPGAERQLTEMEIALMDQVAQLILTEWCKPWKRFHELRPELVGHENSSRFLQSSSGDTIMLLLTLDARMGECLGKFQLAIPYQAFEGILAKVIESAVSVAPPLNASAALKWNRSLDALPICLNVRWPSFKVPAGDLLRLKAGELLPLDAAAAERIEVRVGPAVKFRGRLGIRDQKWAIQICEVSKL